MFLPSVRFEHEGHEFASQSWTQFGSSRDFKGQWMLHPRPFSQLAAQVIVNFSPLFL